LINIFISAFHTYTVTPFLRIWEHEAARFIRLVPYEKIHRLRKIHAGLFIFSDIDRLTATQREMALRLCDDIARQFGEKAIYNHPAQVLTRYQLLTLLWEKGINEYRVFRINYRYDKVRYPVFIRRTDDHSGSLTPLIGDEESFGKELHRLQEEGADLSELMVAEFCDTRAGDDLFYKYAAFRIGEAIVPAHIIHSRDWVTKDMPPEELRDEEKYYLVNNPHREELMNIFRMANIGYGRIDYGLKDGKIQVWEINTNPVLIQGRDKYAHGKLPLKQKLADDLSSAFISGHMTIQQDQGDKKSINVNLSAPGFRNLLREIRRFCAPIDL